MKCTSGAENEARLGLLPQNDHWPEEPRRHTPNCRRQPCVRSCFGALGVTASETKARICANKGTKGGLCVRALNSVTK